MKLNTMLVHPVQLVCTLALYSVQCEHLVLRSKLYLKFYHIY